MLAADALSFCLRVGEVNSSLLPKTRSKIQTNNYQLAFSATVAGLTGQYLHAQRHQSAWSKKRFIYTEVVAAIGILFALLFLFPFTASFIHWPMDLLLFAMFMVAFGLLANFIGPMNCGSIWNWDGITGKQTCSKFKADLAFCFLASIFFLISALLVSSTQLLYI
jgi:hypothetical protein